MTTLATTIPSAASADAERFQTTGVVTVTAGHAVNDTYTSFLPPLPPATVMPPRPSLIRLPVST